MIDKTMMSAGPVTEGLDISQDTRSGIKGDVDPRDAEAFRKAYEGQEQNTRERAIESDTKRFSAQDRVEVMNRDRANVERTGFESATTERIGSERPNVERNGLQHNALDNTGLDRINIHADKTNRSDINPEKTGTRDFDLETGVQKHANEEDTASLRFLDRLFDTNPPTTGNVTTAPEETPDILKSADTQNESITRLVDRLLVEVSRRPGTSEQVRIQLSDDSLFKGSEISISRNESGRLQISLTAGDARAFEVFDQSIDMLKKQLQLNNENNVDIELEIRNDPDREGQGQHGQGQDAQEDDSHE